MGRTILEAITSKTPIIATKCGAFPEIISSFNGVIIDSDDPKILAKEIMKTSSQHFSEDIKDKYDFNKVFDNYLRIWRNNG
jgi:glycosyltransferase involved in cell wall biosynthesis